MPGKLILGFYAREDLCRGRRFLPVALACYYHGSHYYAGEDSPCQNGTTDNNSEPGWKPFLLHNPSGPDSAPNVTTLHCSAQTCQVCVLVR